MIKRLLLLLVLLILLVSVLSLPILSSAQGLIDNYLPMIFKTFDWHSTFGLEMHDISTETLTRAKELNSQWLRYNALLWSEYQPDNASQFIRNTALENELIAANQSGQEVILIVRSTPTWAQQVENSYCGPIEQESLDEFGDFMQTLVETYSQLPYDVKYFELWNEPEDALKIDDGDAVYGCWGDPADQYYGGEYYAEMLKAIYSKMKAANPDVQVVIGGLLLDCDPREDVGVTCNSEEAQRFSNFFAGILQNNGGSYFDLVNFHGYAYKVGHQSPIVTESTQQNWAPAGGQVEGKLDYLKEQMLLHGISKPILLTEAGLICSGCTFPNPEYEEFKAEYLVWLYTRNWARDIFATAWYTLDGGWRGTGLINTSGDPMPAFDAYKVLTNTLQGATFSDEIDLASQNIRIFEFDTADKIWVLFSMDGEAKTLYFSSVSEPSGMKTAFDLYGTSVTINNTLVSFDQPIYIVFDQ